MFDGDEVFGQKIPNPTFMQRSSNPNEHDSRRLEVDPSIYYNNSNNNPNTQPRNRDNDTIGNLLQEELDESGGAGNKTSLLSSLMVDQKNRNPMDLIQDFPSTQSSLYSSNRHLFTQQGQQEIDNNEDNLLKSMSSRSNNYQPRDSNSNPSNQPNRNGENSLEHATLAMQQLYVSGEEEHQRNRSTGNGNVNADYREQYGLRGRGGQGRENGGGNGSGNGGGNGPQQGMEQNGGYGNGRQPPMHPGQPPQFVTLDGTPPGPQSPGSPPAYFVQQPMYLDQNGQPIYYRVPGAPYQQEVIYASTAETGPNGEHMVAYMPYPGGNQPMHPQGFWPGGPGEQPPMYGPNGQPDPNNMMRRVMYNAPQFIVNGPPIRPGAYPIPYDNRRMMGSGEVRDERMRHGGGGGGGDRGIRNQSSPRPDNYGRVNSAVNPMRDPLVDEFRATYGKSRQWELVDLLGHVVAFCQDQHGSRFIQQKLEVCPDVDKQLIFDEIIPAAHSLMTDVFGNYVLQKLFEYGTPDQCETLALLLTGQSVQLSMQMYGCRVVQKALEYVSTQRLIALVSEFENSQVLLRCVHDSNGNHVIQKCIEVVSKVAKEASTPELSEYLSSRIMFIINSFQGRVKELSSHPYGCRVVQRILEHCSNPQKAVILEELRKCCAELVQDCYGNYVIQFVMQHGWEADRAVLIKEVQANLLEFATHKFASNVVEKCLQYASKRDRDEMIWTIINVTFDLNNPVDAKTGHCVLESMVRDPYANYVVQKVIDVSDERQRGAIMRYVRENITQLRRYTYGKHIIVRLEKITNEKF